MDVADGSEKVTKVKDLGPIVEGLLAIVDGRRARTRPDGRAAERAGEAVEAVEACRVAEVTICQPVAA